MYACIILCLQGELLFLPHQVGCGIQHFPKDKTGYTDTALARTNTAPALTHIAQLYAERIPQLYL